MTQSIESPALESTTRQRREIPRALWRLAGGLAIAHVVLMLGGNSQERSPFLTDSPDVVKQTFVGADVSHVFAGGYLEALGFIVLLPVLVFLARAIGQRTEAGRWASQTALAAGLCYVAISLATAIPAGAAALYGAHHGIANAATLAVVDNVRNFAFYVSILALGAQAVGIGIAAVTDKAMKRWVGFGGIAIGILLFAGVAAAGYDGVNVVFIPWMVWWVGLGIGLIRRGSAEA